MTWARQWGRGEASSSLLGPSHPRSSQVVVWKRYSDFRKLHGDLAYTHRNLFRRLEEFPAFPRAQVFGECVWASGPRGWESWAPGPSAGGGRRDRAVTPRGDIPGLGGPGAQSGLALMVSDLEHSCPRSHPFQDEAARLRERRGRACKWQNRIPPHKPRFPAGLP